MAGHKKKKNIGEALLKAIDENGVKVVDLAAAIGVSQSMIYKYTTNKKDPSDATLQKISDYFKLPVEYFTGDLYDSEGNELVNFPQGNLKDFFNDKLHQHRIRQYAKNAVKTYNYLLDNCESDEQVDLVIRLYSLIRSFQHGDPQLDFASGDLESVDKELEQLSFILSTLANEVYGTINAPLDHKELLQRISYSHHNTAFNKQLFSIYKQGFEAGILSSLSSEQFNKLTVLKQLELSQTKKISTFSRFLLIDIDEIYVGLQNESLYQSALSSIKRAINDLHNDHIELVEWEAKYFIDKLRKIDEILFKEAAALLVDLLDEDPKQLEYDLDILQKAIQNKINEVIILANKYK